MRYGEEMKREGEGGKRGRGRHSTGSRFQLGEFYFFFFFFFYQLPFGQLKLKLFHPMAKTKRRHDTSNETVEFSIEVIFLLI